MMSKQLPMKKIAVFGSAGSISTQAEEICIEIGRLLAKYNCTVLTGACPGASYAVAKPAFECGAHTVGFSPARSKKEHIDFFKDPTDVFSELRFIPESFAYPTVKQACYKFRNISTALECDGAIIVSGRVGTLNEFTLAYDFEKPIGVVTGTGGIADELFQLVENMGWGARESFLEFSDNPELIIEKLLFYIEHVNEQ